MCPYKINKQSKFRGQGINNKIIYVGRGRVEGIFKLMELLCNFNRCQIFTAEYNGLFREI